MSISDRVDQISSESVEADEQWDCGRSAFNADNYAPPIDVALANGDLMLAALRAVLDLHRPLRLYEHEDVCGRTDEEHCDERHVEFEESCEYYCLDHPTDYVLCAECRDVNGDSVDYPCPTVRAIEDALGEGQ